MVSPADLFFDFSGPKEAWPSNTLLILGVRFGGLAAAVLGLYFLRYRARFVQRTPVGRATILLILASVLIGLDYLVFQASVTIFKAVTAGGVSVHQCYGATAAAVFLLCQIAAVIDLSNGNPGFIRWILPPVVYLFVIGILAGFVFGNPAQLVVDSVRAVVLFRFSLAAFRGVRPGR